MDKFQNKYRITSTRLQNWDYGWNAAYFVIICTKDRAKYYGDVIDGQIQLSPIGQLVDKFWVEFAAHFPFVILDAFVIMPHHVHGILVFDKNTVETRHCPVSTTTATTNNDKTMGQKCFQNPGKNTLSSVVGSYQSVVSKCARQINAGFAWQSRFHDHIIRDAASCKRIANYINNYPLTWAEDKFY